MYLNKALIVGNLTRDPELKALPSGAKVTSFSLATNRIWTDQSGQKKEMTDYHNIVVFGRQAETSAQYLVKGQSVLVEGRIQTRSWDGQDGKKNYRTEIVADRVQFGSKGGQGTGTPDSAPTGEVSAPSATPDSESASAIEYPDDDINPEDIPF